MLKKNASLLRGLKDSCLSWVSALRLCAYTFLIRSRSHEIAILLSLGVEKFKILSQLLLETVLVFLIASFLLAITSPIIPQFISGDLLRGALEEETILIDGVVMEGGSGLEVSINEHFSEVALTQFSIPSTTILTVMVTMVLLITISIILASTPIMRLRPKDIFSRMS